MNSAYLLLGSNEGDRLGWLQSAKESINNSIGNITAASSIYETAAWGLEEQPSFYNQVILTTTLLEPRELLHVVNQIELENGRQRVLKWGQRTLDIDILFFNEQVISEPDLRIPHPFMEQRR
ncbi:MAG: 2-amino-4-hydroxy-6-hydroxymethyldihydropteridine diphosphokinase, partial [Sphingobacteriales bacterium]